MLGIRGLEEEAITFVAYLAVEPNKKTAELTIERALLVFCAGPRNHFRV